MLFLDYIVYCIPFYCYIQIAIKILSLVYVHFGKLQSNTFTEIPTDFEDIDVLENEIIRSIK